VAIIGLALTGPLIFGPLALNYLGSEMLRLDAAFVTLVSGHPSTGNVVEFAASTMRAEGKQMVIYPGCSSLANMSLVGVLFAVVTQTLNVQLTRPMWLLAFAMILGVMAINAMRLSAMAIYPDHFEFLHTGTGAQIFALGSLVLAGAIILTGALRNLEPRHA
jgi:exosortase/archaeosortase family protein